jgi:hypothetical protein
MKIVHLKKFSIAYENEDNEGFKLNIRVIGSSKISENITILRAKITGNTLFLYDFNGSLIDIIEE